MNGIRLTISNRLITIYDVKLELKWSGKASDGVRVDGKLLIPEVSHEVTLDGLSEYTVRSPLRLPAITSPSDSLQSTTGRFRRNHPNPSTPYTSLQRKGCLLSWRRNLQSSRPRSLRYTGRILPLVQSPVAQVPPCSPSTQHLPPRPLNLQPNLRLKLHQRRRP